MATTISKQDHIMANFWHWLHIELKSVLYFPFVFAPIHHRYGGSKPTDQVSNVHLHEQLYLIQPGSYAPILNHPGALIRENTITNVAGLNLQSINHPQWILYI